MWDIRESLDTSSSNSSSDPTVSDRAKDRIPCLTTHWSDCLILYSSPSPLSSGKMRYANNSNYKNDTMIRKEAFVHKCVLEELKRIIEDSEIMARRRLPLATTGSRRTTRARDCDRRPTHLLHDQQNRITCRRQPKQRHRRLEMFLLFGSGPQVSRLLSHCPPLQNQTHLRPHLLIWFQPFIQFFLFITNKV